MSDQVEFADELCRNVDHALAERLKSQAAKASRGALVRRLYPVIQKYRRVGMTLEEIASVLQEQGYDLNRGHLVWHLGRIDKESPLGVVTPHQEPLPIEQEVNESGEPAEVDSLPSNKRDTRQADKPSEPKPKAKAEIEPKAKKSDEASDLSFSDPLELEGTWITGAPVKWWPAPKVSDSAPAECPLPMPLRYALPVELRPKDMPAVPDDWSIYKLTEGKRDKHRLPDTGSVLRKWWCFFSPRLSSTSRLYGVLPGIDPEAPYGRYPDGRPYTSDDEVWGLGQGGAVRQLSMIDKVPPGEVTPVDLFLGFPGSSSSSVGDALLFDPADSPDVLEWKEAAKRCGQPTDPPEVT